ncbi:family 1 glycosylhydrolase [Ruminococcaceae bacterium OttesenSCG-928-A11]|nr:family 1 glycosylhydrolase [Ruminococcaceae bacterium OttesenSCG-928-A11]
MSRFPKGFMLGTATAAHQVEGNNIHSDSWALEQLPNSIYLEPSLDAVDHYNRYEEDIKMMAKAGMNAYRFTIEWARIEPEKGMWVEEEVDHYRRVLQCCHDNSIIPMVCFHHFSSPKWLISMGGWEEPQTAVWFAEFCERAVKELGDLLVYVNTINEANMGLQFGKLIQDRARRVVSDVQVGVNEKAANKYMSYMMEAGEALGVGDKGLNIFHSPRTPIGDGIIIQAHVLARDAIKKIRPDLKVGISLSLHDMQPLEGGDQFAKIEWIEEFTHYLPYIEHDDFLGVQSYTRKLFGPEGVLQPADDAKRTQMGYEDYPMAVVNCARKAAEDFKGDIIITESGIGTDDDERRIEFIREALDGVEEMINDGIPVKGYLYWSLMDNFEWMVAYTRTFGLVAVDRATQQRHPKPSFAFLASQR